jgi:ABC-type lipoprotein export system ATPase subunit
MPAILAVQSVSKHYLRGVERIDALADISFQIDQPAVVAIAGPSGSGKSTLLSLLARFDRPDSGQILLDGICLDQVPDSALDTYRNRKLGFVFQQFNLLNVMTAQENVELALLPQKCDALEKRRRASEMLELVGLGNRRAHRPHELSGGQQQRVAIARALVGRPRFVIADEPTGNLDRKTAHDILALIGDLNRQMGTTFIIATHDQRVMDSAHRTIALEDGRHQS